MKFKTRILCAAVTACFGLAAQQAGAATTVDLTTGATSTPLNLPNENISGQGIAAGSVLVQLSTVPGLNVGTAPLTVRFDLTNGVKFNSTPTLGCDNLASGASALVGAVVVGGNATNSVTFNVTSGATNASATMTTTAMCYLSAAYVTTGNITNKGVSATYSYSIGGVTTQASSTGNFITFSKSLGTTFSPGGTVTVDATKGGTKFVTAGTVSAVSLTTAALGSFSFGSAGSALSGTTHLSAATVLSTASVTFTGPSLAAGFSSVSGDIYLVSGADCTTNAIQSYNSRSGNSVTFNNFASLSSWDNGPTLCMTVNGSTQITTGAITGVLTATPITGYAVDTSAAANAMTKLGTNGSTMNAFFINASNSTSKTSVIRIIDQSGYDSGTLTGTAYAESGAVLGTANTSLGTVKNNGMLTLTSANIESLLGITGLAPTAKYRLVISSDMNNFKVINYIQDVGTGAIHLAQQQDN